MYAVILAGGSGTRLWPLSRELFPKQYLSLPVMQNILPLNTRSNNNLQSFDPSGMVENADSLNIEDSLFISTVKRVSAFVSPTEIIVVTHLDQAGEINRQLEEHKIEGVRLLAEPEARNTAPAIGLAANYIASEAGPQAVMAVLPSDHLIPDTVQFAELLKYGFKVATDQNLITFGIRPTYPETGYGYICCGEQLDTQLYKVERFVEKPNLEKAETYLKDERYLWNSGMFVFKIAGLIDAYRKYLPEMQNAFEQINYETLGNLASIYPSLEKISIDYGILEKAGGVTVIPTDISWSDLGSWEAYYQLAEHDQNGNFIRGRVAAVNSKNNLIHAASRLVGVAGINDLVVVDTPDALLVCDRNRSQDVKAIVDQLKEADVQEAREHRTIYRPWGSYTSLELGTGYQVKRINVNPGARLSLQSHRHRAENWIVVEGEAIVTIDDDQLQVKKGESAYIPKGARHRMENPGKIPLVLIEVQNGEYLGEDDIVRYEDDYGRIESSPPPIRGEGWVGSEPKSSPSSLQTRPSSLPLDRSGEQKSLVKQETKELNSLSNLAIERFNYWIEQTTLDPAMHRELEAMRHDSEAIESHFGSELVFGTGGMRGIIGPGLNRINCYTICRAAQGLADYISGLQSPGSKKVAIAHDTRHHSAEYARETALVLAANGIKALLFSDIRPTPMLSFTTRELGCSAGVVITASHNPPAYNGFKVYGPDGGQAVSPLVDDIIRAIEKIDIFKDVKKTTEEEAINRGLLETIDPAYDQAYLEQVSALSLNDPDTCLKVVFTPLHGTGSVYIPNLLTQTRCISLTLVEEQMKPDPNFNTVRVPNPEDPAALEMALKLAERVEAELVLATDPDADRVGTAVRDKQGKFVILNGNQMGALLIEYICSSLVNRQLMPQEPVLIKTIVTGELGRRVAESYGLKTVETLTGFKFIGEKIKDFEALGKPDFIFGYEESCGYLTGTFVRDKDAIIATFLIAEMTAFYKEQGKSLLEVLDEIQQQHGYFSEELLTIELSDISEADRYVDAYHKLPPDFAGQKIVEKRDYDKGLGWRLNSGEEYILDLPRSPVLHYTLDDGSWFAVRPSGTEPKVKFYLSVCAADAVQSQEKLKLLHDAVIAVK